MQINIGFGVNDGFVQHLGVLMTSILYNSSLEDDYTFYIVTDYISDDNKAKFEALKKLRPCEIKYLEINREEYDNIKGSDHLGLSTYFRYQLFKLEEIDKILYLDADMICRKDVRELYEIDLGEYPIAGVEDIRGPHMVRLVGLSPTTTYINAGMILIDLKKTRHIDFMKLSTEEIPSVFDNWKFSDQDMINYVFEHNILLLDIKWNFSYPFPNYYKDIDYYNKTSKDPAIIHWIERKPWIPKVRNAHMVEEYFKYLKLSPWNSLEWFINYIIEGNLVILDAIWAIHSKLRIKPETELIKFQEDSRY